MSIRHIIIFFAVLTSSFAHADVDFLAYGDLRGYFEPCGCDPATDMGGVLRINSQLQRERLSNASNPGFLVLNLGNNLSAKPRDIIKNRYLLRAEVVNRPDAYLLNERELQHLPKDAPKLPFVISNVKTKRAGVVRVIDSKKALILGYVWNERVKGDVQRVDSSMLSVWKSDAAKKNKRPMVLLFSGPDQDLETIIDARVFDVVISSNTTSFANEPGKEESQDESRLIRRVGAANIYMVPVGGQGILRGGRLTLDEAKPVSAYLQQPSSPFAASPSQSGTIFDRKVMRVSWLLKSTEPGHALADLYASYSAALAESFKQNGKQRIAALKNSPFAGEAACATCHTGTHELYKKSAHALAMKTLIDRNKHQDPECVACHSVGAEVEGGFVSVADSPQFANVQCENCHGPRKDHVTNPTIQTAKLTVREGTCKGCHNPQHSPNFDFKSYWEKIKH